MGSLTSFGTRSARLRAHKFPHNEVHFF